MLRCRSMMATAYVAFLWCVSCALMLGASQYPRSEPEFNFPLVKQFYKFPVYTPVAIITSAATIVCLPKMKINVNNVKLIVKNDGQKVQLTPASSRTVLSMEGGPLTGAKYIFSMAEYNADGYPNATRVGDTVDGVGYAVKFWFLLYNERYGSANNSFYYPDGFVRLNFVVTVLGKVDNPYFKPLQKILDAVRKPNSTASIYAKEAFCWLLKAFVNGRPYYSYPGKYLSRMARKFYYTTEIQPSFTERPWMSYPQYKTFGKIIDQYGQPEFGAVAQYPLGPRPFIEAADSPVIVRYR